MLCSILGLHLPALLRFLLSTAVKLTVSQALCSTLYLALPFPALYIPPLAQCKTKEHKSFNLLSHPVYHVVTPPILPLT